MEERGTTVPLRGNENAALASDLVAQQPHIIDDGEREARCPTHVYETESTNTQQGCTSLQGPYPITPSLGALRRGASATEGGEGTASARR